MDKNQEFTTGTEGARFDGLSALHAFTTGDGITAPPYWAPSELSTGNAPDPATRLIQITGDIALVYGDVDALRQRIHELYDAGEPS
jgi:hypothetical protein